MMKDLIWLPWAFAALILGILICLGMIAYLLFFAQPQAAYYPGAYLVKGAMAYAALA